jgi:MFS family permease
MAALLRRVQQGRAALPRHRDLVAFCVLHVVHDGFVAGLYPLLPLLAADLGLSYGEAGFLKLCLSAAAGLLQLPAGLLVERAGERLIVGGGVLWLATTYGLLALGVTLPQLALSAALAGVGSSPQHVGPAAFLSRAYDAGGRGAALGLWNFSGDLGKGLLPIIGGLVAVIGGWRWAVAVLAIGGGLVALGVLWRWRAALRQSAAQRAVGEAARGWGLTAPGRFSATMAVGVLDTAVRDGALLLLPFLLATAGYGPPAIGALFALLFAFGATGKFICGPLSDRHGAVVVILATEASTAALLLALISAPALWLVPLVALFGVAMSGTSSALADLVARHVRADRRARGYGIYYSFTQATTAWAPFAFGLLADVVGLQPAVVALAALALATLPLTLLARPSAAARSGLVDE